MSRPHSLPKLVDDGTLSGPCCPKPAGIPELHKVCRTLPPPVINNGPVVDVLQDEDYFPILDEVTGGTIFDDLRE